MVKSLRRCVDNIFELECICDGNCETLKDIFSQFTTRDWLVTHPDPYSDGLYSPTLFGYEEYREHNNPIILGISTALMTPASTNEQITETIASIRSSDWTDNLALYWDCDSLTMFFMGQYEPILANFNTKGLKLKNSKYMSTYCWLEK